MPKFTIERTFDVPHYRHVTYDAPDLETALKMDAENDDWDNQKEDFDCSGPERVIGAWKGEDAYSGPDLMAPSRANTKSEHPIKIVRITMEGGVIQHTNIPAGVRLLITDYDVDGCEDVVQDANGDDCVVHTWDHEPDMDSL